MGTRPKLPRDQRFEPKLREDQSIKLIGLGGVGSSVARYGAMWLASVARHHAARLVLIDGDSFEAKNASRMLFSRAGHKAVVVRDELLNFSTLVDSRLAIVAITEHVAKENVQRLIHNEDIVILAVDNHATRKLVNDHCALLDDVVLISGGNDGMGEDSTGNFRRGTFGNCQIFIRRGGQNRSPTLSQYHPEIEKPADRLPSESCTAQIASVPQLPLANLQAASTILNTLWLYLSGVLHYSELAFDIAEGLMSPVPIPAPELGGVLKSSA